MEGLAMIGDTTISFFWRRQMTRLETQRGSGLLGILIALIVIAIGGIALTSLIGKLTTGSGDSKARNEALELAQEKIEELRNFVEIDQFNEAMKTRSDTVTGKNAVFARNWTVTDENGGTDDLDNLKRIIMEVSYTDSDKQSQKVLLNSFILFSNPTIAATIASGGDGNTGGLAPSTEKSAIEGPEPDTTTTLGDLDPVPGETAAADKRVYTSVNSNGNLVVYQGEVAVGNVPDDKIKLTVFGGKLLRINGILHYGDDIPQAESDLYVRGTSPSFCTWFPTLACDPLPDSGFNCGYYVCYAGGDCSMTTGGTNGCPADTSELPTDLNGGWYGRIGVYYLNKNEPHSCVTDDEDNLIPARLYVSNRWYTNDPPTPDKYEGINSSYDGTLTGGYNEHNFIRVKKKPDCRDLPPDLATHQAVRCLLDDALNSVRGTNEVYEMAPSNCDPTP